MSENKSNSIWPAVKLGLILMVYAVISCTVLALVNHVTAPVIAKNQQEKANAAMKVVFENASGFSAVAELPAPPSATIRIDALYAAKDSSGNIIGAVCQVTGPTYESSTILVGVDTSGTVTGMRYIENKDTKNFGAKGSDEKYKLPSGKTFYEQFAGKKVADGFTAGSTFDAISGATITSVAVGKLIDAAASVACEYLGGAK